MATMSQIYSTAVSVRNHTESIQLLNTEIEGGKHYIPFLYEISPLFKPFVKSAYIWINFDIFHCLDRILLKDKFFNNYYLLNVKIYVLITITTKN